MADENKDVWSSLTKTELLSALILGGMSANSALALHAGADPKKFVKAATLYAVRLQQIAKETEEEFSDDDAVDRG